MSFLIHIVTVPATFMAGFALGWVLRGKALEKRR